MIQSYIRGILKNEHYIGKVRWNHKQTKKTVVDGEIVARRRVSDDYLVFPGKQPAIIDMETWNAVQERFGNIPRNNKAGNLSNPLSGILYCSCGRTMRRHTFVEKGIERMGRPLQDIQTAVENMGNVEVARLEKGLPMLATIAGGAPMIGFLGTVMGMVQAFFNMAQAGSNIDITLLSGGIYTAMVTTVAGLIVGIMAYFGYNFLTAQVSDVVFKMQNTTVEFMDMLHEPAGRQ